MENQANLFKTRRFLPLFITQFFGAFNDNVFKNAFLIWFTYDIITYHGLDASIMVTVAGGLFILPFFLFSATAGQLASKYEKSMLAQRIKIVEILLMFACGVFFYTKSVTGLLVILFMMGVQSTLFGPIKYSLLPEHLREDELISGNAWVEAGTFLSILLGTIFGGIIITVDNGIILLALSVVFFAAVGYVASRSIPKSSIPSPNLQINWNFASETWSMLKYAREHKSVWLSIVSISWFWYIGITFLTLFPVYTKFIIQGNELLVTFFMTVFSVGIAIGSAMCNKLLKGKITTKFIPHASLGMSAAIALLFISSKLYMVSFAGIDDTSVSLLEFLSISVWSYGILGSLLLLSVFGGIYIVPLYAIMQHYSDKKYLAMIVASNNVINSLAMVLASVLASILLLIGLDTIGVFLVVGVMNLVVYVFVRKVIKVLHVD